MSVKAHLLIFTLGNQNSPLIPMRILSAFTIIAGLFLFVSFGAYPEDLSLEQVLNQAGDPEQDAIDNNPLDSAIEEILSQEQKKDFVPAQTGVIPVIRRPALAFRILNKAAKSTKTISLNVGEETTYETLQIKLFTCQERPPEYIPETGAFLQIFENNNQKIFSGWMFASSPSLSPFEHPLYDIYILGCLNKGEQYEEKTRAPLSILPPASPERPAALTRLSRP